MEKLTIDVWIILINTDLISFAKLKAIKSPIKRIFMINVDLISSVNNKKNVKLWIESASNEKNIYDKYDMIISYKFC